MNSGYCLGRWSMKVTYIRLKLMYLCQKETYVRLQLIYLCQKETCVLYTYAVATLRVRARICVSCV